MIHVCICLVGWKKTWATHLLSLLCEASYRVERENHKIFIKYKQTMLSVRSFVYSFGKADAMRRANERYTSASEMCTMTSLLNEKFLHIIGCVVYTREAYESNIHTCKHITETLKDTLFALTKESARWLFSRFGPYNALILALTENSTGYSLSFFFFFFVFV